MDVPDPDPDPVPVRLYKSKDDDILLHSLVLGHSDLSFNKVIKSGLLKEIVAKRELYKDLVCIRKTGRCVNQGGLLFCAAVYYVLHPLSKEGLSAEINNICKIPSDLFQLINIVLNEDRINNNFNDFNGVQELFTMCNTNPLNPSRKRKKKKRSEQEISSQLANMTVKERNVSKCISQHKFIKKWYLDPNKTALDLLYQFTKYKSRAGWDHQMILRNAHLKFKADDSERGDINFVISYILHGTKSIMKKDSSFCDYYSNAENPEYKGVPGLSPITSRVYAAVHVLDKSKRLLGECEIHIDKLAKCIKDFVRMRDVYEIPQQQQQQRQDEVEEHEEDNMEGSMMIAGIGGEDFSLAHTSFYQPDNVVDEGPLQRFHIVHEHLPTLLNVQPKIWEALLKDLPMTALIRNICHMANLGVLSPDPENKENVDSLIEKLTNENRLRRIHPFQILKAVMEYSSYGTSGRKKKYKQKGWEMNEQVKEALVDSFFLTLGNELMGNRSELRYKVCIQRSGTMMMPNFTGDPKLSRGKAAVAMALGIQHYFKNTTIRICHKSEVSENRISPMADDKPRFCNQVRKMKLHREPKDDANTPYLSLPPSVDKNEPSNLALPVTKSTPYSDPPPNVDKNEPSNLALPITKSIKGHEKIDAFVFFTTSIASELTGGSPYEEFLRYQKEVKPSAKMIICAMDVNPEIIADPDNKDVKVLCGADGHLVKEIYQFMHPDRVSNSV